MSDKIYYCLFCERYACGEKKELPPISVIEIRSRFDPIPTCDSCGDLAHSYIIREK